MYYDDLGTKWNRIDTELKVYEAVTLSTLLYACETWKYTNVIPRGLTVSI